MAIGENSLIEVVFNMSFLSQQTLNVWQYEISDYIATPSLVQILEGYWNHVKATYRAIIPSNYGNVFISLKGRELNNLAGDYAEFDIPTGERAGTRATTGDQMPPFLAAGVRLVVGTRQTRPGQKRFSGVLEADNVGGVLQASYATPLIALMNVMVANMTLGAPAALTILRPIVTRKDDGGNVTAFQGMTGYLINPQVTSQNTRKVGRGA